MTLIIRDRETEVEIGTGILKKVDDNLTELYVTPKKNGITYYHLTFKMQLPQPYETMKKMNEITINGVLKTTSLAIENYKKLIDNKIDVKKISYELGGGVRKYNTNQLKLDVDEYLQIPHQLHILKETNTLSEEKALDIIARKESLEKKLIKANVINPDGSFK